MTQGPRGNLQRPTRGGEDPAKVGPYWKLKLERRTPPETATPPPSSRYALPSASNLPDYTITHNGRNNSFYWRGTQMRR